MTVTLREEDELFSRVASRKVDRVKKFLSKNDQLDITYKEGALFAVAIRNDKYEIVSLLLEYFNTKQLSDLTIGAPKHNALKFKLKSSLDYALEQEELSPKMQEVLSSYIDFDDTGTENDLESLGADQHGISDESESKSGSASSDGHSNQSSDLSKNTLDSLSRQNSSDSADSNPIGGYLASCTTPDTDELGANFLLGDHNIDEISPDTI